MINNTTTKNEHPTSGNIRTVYPITFEGATDNSGVPMLNVTLTDDSSTKTLVYNVGYELVFAEVTPGLDESLNTPVVEGLKLLNEEDATAGNHLEICRTTPLMQTIDFQVGRIDPEQIERGFDLSVLRDQELKRSAADLKDYIDTQDAAILEVANEASETAGDALETAGDAKDIAEDASDLAESFDERITKNEEDIAAIIEGGNIDGVTIQTNPVTSRWEVQAVVNQNTAQNATNPIYDWVGTMAEYTDQNIATLHPEWLCYITNDMYDPGSTYSFEQGVAADTWYVTHNLDKYPSVTVVDSAGTTIDCTITYINSNECELKFNAAFKGTAYLN